ncbi:MAG: MOFRL family protein, partial [Candidatus Uhrbacteria bacterium]
LSVIASGPTVMDKTTVLDARRIIKKYKIFDKCKVPYCEPIETPKEKTFFKRAQNYLLVSNQVATEAMQQKAKKLGYQTHLLSNELEGEASKVGADLAKQAKAGQALIAAGETTVTVRGKGKGGRNQELVLGAIAKLPPDTLVCSVASDGIDNTPVAGAFVDEQVLESIKTRKLDPKTALQTNDSYPFLQKLRCQIKTGKTGANVSDLMLVLRDRQA